MVAEALVRNEDFDPAGFMEDAVAEPASSTSKEETVKWSARANELWLQMADISLAPRHLNLNEVT